MVTGIKRIFIIFSVLLLGLLMAGCESGKEQETVSILRSDKIVGKDILIEDITDFYYTEENINFDAFYQRYRFYAEDGKYYFFHETRERKNDYGWCTEEDTTLIGTLVLSEEQWSAFYEIIKDGIVEKRKDSADAGGSGPWYYLYWKNDKSKYQEYSFASYENEKKFEEYCISLRELEQNG